MINILIADDHPIVRSGLKQIITDEEDMVVSGEAKNGIQVLELLKEDKYDILILDINLPDITGMEVLNRIKQSKINIPVLILSVLPEEQYAVRMIESGASGYINKMAASDQLIIAIRKIIAGGFYINPALSENHASVISKNKKQTPHQNLSAREFEIMCLIASGKCVKEIAEKLTLGVPTIYSFRTKILQKLNLKNDSELIQYCIKEGLIS